MYYSLIMNKLLLFVVLIFIYVCSAWKLTVPHVFLPLFKSHSVNFTLETSNAGCYKWTLSRSDVIRLTPANIDEDLDCLSKVIISPITKEFVNNAVIVLVEDINTGEVLRCNVIVDVIASLSIATVTRTLYLEEAPEAFIVRAHDEEGNEFSTLEGVEFIWTVNNIGQPDPSTILKLIMFRDSHYDAPPSIQKLESNNLTGHIVLFEAAKTGSATLSVSLKYWEYAHVPPLETVLKVLIKQIIFPSNVYILKGDMINYKILQLIGGQLVEIELESSRYYLEVENEKIVRDIAPWTIEGVEFGRTNIHLRDRYVNNTSLSLASIIVDKPISLGLITLPNNNWTFVEYQPNAIAVEIFGSGNSKIHIGPSVVVRISVDEADYYIKEKTPNGTYITGWPRKPGVMRIRAQLYFVANHAGNLINFDNDFSTERNATVYSKLSVHPPVVYIAWQPKSTVRLEAIGGDNIYEWNSDNDEIVSFDFEPEELNTAGGILNVRDIGTCTVSVRMRNSRDNVATAPVNVLRITALKILNDILESNVGHPVYLRIALYGDIVRNDLTVKIPFTHCAHIPFKFKFLDGEFTYNVINNNNDSSSDKKQRNNLELIDSSCAVVEIIGKTEIVTQLTVSYENVLEDNVMVSMYDSLRLLEPRDSKEIILAVDSQRRIVYRGGRRFLSDVYRVRPRVQNIPDDVEDDSIISVVERRSFSEQHDGVLIYSITCRKIGSAIVSLETNGDNDDKNLSLLSRVKIICAKPRYVEIITTTIGSDNRCFNDNISSYTALNYDNFRIDVIVKDELKRVFDNATGLKVDWIFSDYTLASVTNPGVILLEEKQIVTTTLSLNEYVPSGHYQIIVPNGLIGRTNVTILISSRNNDYSIKPVETTFSLSLVGDVVVFPEIISIVNYPQYNATVRLKGGSGYYEITANASDIVNWKLWSNDATSNNNSTNSITVIPIKIGTVNLTVTDVCANSKPASISIRVVTLAGAKLDIKKKLAKGDRYEAVLKLYDSNGDLVTGITGLSKLLRIKPILESNNDAVIISVTEEETDVERELLLFHVHALELGFVGLTFSIAVIDTSIVLYSKTVGLEIFDPLTLTLINTDIMIPGSITRIIASGGPTCGSTIKYFSDDNAIVEIDRDDIVRAIAVGRVNVTGKVIDVHATMVDIVDYSIARIEINVVALTDIKIKTPSSSLFVGMEMPVQLLCQPTSLTLFVVGSVSPPFELSWKSSNPEVADVYNVFHNVGIRNRIKTNMLAVRIKGLQEGVTTILVEIKVPFQNQIFHSSIVVNVWNLKFIFPSCALSLLLPPNTYYPITTNADDNYKVTFEMLDRSAVSVASINSSGSLITSDKYGKFHLEVVFDNGEHREVMVFPGEVKRIHYIMINAYPTLYPSGTNMISTLPVGVQLKLNVSFHDEFGNTFTYAENKIKFHFNTLDKVTVLSEKHNSIEVVLEKDGETIIEAYDENHSDLLKDYVKLSVTNHIIPQQVEVVAGDIICFSIPHLSHDTNSGEWFSSDDTSLFLELKSGIARALSGPNKVMIYYMQKNGVSMKTSINILPLRGVSFIGGRNNITNNGKAHVFPLLLLPNGDDTFMSRKTNNLITTDHPCVTSPNYKIDVFPFHCKVSFQSSDESSLIHEIFSVKEHFDFKIGLYSCVLEEADDSLLVAYNIRSNIVISVVWGEGVESKAFDFIPAVYIFSQELILNSSNTEAEFFIYGQHRVLNQLQIMANSTVIRVVERYDKDNTLVGGYIYLNETYKGSIDNAASITIISPLTDQLINMVVTLTPDTDSASISNKDQDTTIITSRNVVIITVSVTIATILMFLLYCSRTRNTPQSTVIPENNENNSTLLSSTFDDIRPINGVTRRIIR